MLCDYHTIAPGEIFAKHVIINVYFNSIQNEKMAIYI